MNKFVAWTACALLACGLAAGPVFAQESKPEEKKEEPKTAVDASKGGVSFKSGNNSLTLGARVQVRWTGEDREDYDSDTIGAGKGEADGFASGFDVARMRLSLKGGMWKPWLKYEFQYEFARTSGTSSNKIKDAYLEFETTKATALKLGQYKVPFSLQQLTSSGRQELVDRAITDGKFDPGRDIGLSFWGTAAGKKFGYQVGLFNGGGEGNLQDDSAYMYVGRVVWDPLGEFKPFESDLDAPDAKPALHFGLAYRTGEPGKGLASAGVFDGADDQTAWTLEAAFRGYGLFALGSYFQMTDELSNPLPDRDVDSRGYNLQVGYMIVPKTFEIALRYALVEPDTDVDDAEVDELRLGFNYFFAGHNLKLQADVGTVGYGSNYLALPLVARRGLPPLGTRLGVSSSDPSTWQSFTDKVARLQFQLAF